MRHFRSVAGPESCHDRAARSRFFQTSWFRAVIAWNWDALTVPSLGWVLLDRGSAQAYVVDDLEGLAAACQFDFLNDHRDALDGRQTHVVLQEDAFLLYVTITVLYGLHGEPCVHQGTLDDDSCGGLSGIDSARDGDL